MHVQKIKIELEDFDHDPKRGPYVDFVKTPRMDFMVSEGAAMEEFTTNFERERWEIIQVSDDKKTKRNYLLKVDDRGMFKELETIFNQRVDREIAKAHGAGYSKGLSEGYESGHFAAHGEIKLLPWWKRLFNRF